MAWASGCPGNTSIRRGFSGEGYTCKPFAKCLQLSKCTCAQEPGHSAGKLLFCVVSSTELGQELGRQITIAAISRTSATCRAIPSPVQQGKIAIKKKVYKRFICSQVRQPCSQWQCWADEDQEKAKQKWEHNMCLAQWGWQKTCV